MNLRSLRFRLAVWYFCTVAVILSVAATAYWFEIRKGLDAARDQGLRNRLRGGRAFLEHLGASGDQGLETRFAQVRHFGEMYEVFDERGNLIAESSTLERFPEPQPPPMTAGSSVTFQTTALGDYRVRIAWQKVAIAGQPFILGALDPTDKYDQVLTAFTSFVFFSAPAILLVAVGCGAWLGRKALAPVARITEDAHAIGERNLSARLAMPDSQDEMQRLSETLNDMLARIEQSFERTKQFTADASHELRAPMTLIYTAAQYALRRPRRHEELVETLQKICHEAERTARLIDDLLLLARNDERPDHAALEIVDVRALVQHAADQASILGLAKQVNVVVAISAERLPVCVDTTQLGRLLLILADNAVKYTPAEGTVTVSAVQDSTRVTISVADTGVGIAADDLPHIFERFWRADKVRSRDVNGAGLGLPIAKQIADRHETDITVSSEPGRGSCFTIRLRRCADEAIVTVA